MNAALATTEPPVLATVFRIRIAAMGRPILLFMRFHAAITAGEVRFRPDASELTLMLSRTASAMEQRKETDRTITTLKIRNNIIRKLPDSLFLKESAQKDIPQRLHAPLFQCL